MAVRITSTPRAEKKENKMDIPVDTSRIQYISMAASGALLFVVFILTNKKKIRVEYSILWFLFSFVFVIFSLWRSGMEKAAHAIGVSYAPAALFLVMLGGIFSILIHFSVIISKLKEQNVKLIQELGIARQEIGAIREKSAHAKGHAE